MALAIGGWAQFQMWGSVLGAYQRVAGNDSRFQRYAQSARGLDAPYLRIHYAVSNDSFTRLEAERVVGTRSFLANGAVHGMAIHSSLKFENTSDLFYPYTYTRFSWVRGPITLTVPVPLGFIQGIYDYNKLDGPTGWIYNPGQYEYGTEFGNFTTMRHAMRYYGRQRGTSLEATSSFYDFRDHSGLWLNTSSHTGEAILTQDLGRAGSLQLTGRQVVTEIATIEGKSVVMRGFRADYVVNPAESVVLNATYFNNFNDNRFTLNSYSRRSSGGLFRVSYFGLPRTIVRAGFERRNFDTLSQSQTQTYGPQSDEYSLSFRTQPWRNAVLQSRYRQLLNRNLPNPEFFDHTNIPLVHRVVKRWNSSLGVTIAADTQLTLAYDFEKRDNSLRDSGWDYRGLTASVWTKLADRWFGNLDVFDQRFGATDPAQNPYLTKYNGFLASLAYLPGDRMRYSAGFFTGSQSGDFSDALTQRWFVNARRAVVTGMDWVVEINNQIYSDRKFLDQDFRTWGFRVGLAFQF